MVDLLDEEENEEGTTSVPNDVYQAKNLSDLINAMSEWDWFKTTVRDWPDPEKMSIDLHFTFGRWLRNFILNKGVYACPVEEAPIFYELYQKGLRHTDDMSGVIIEMAWHKCNDIPFSMTHHVEYYQNYWKELFEYDLNRINSAVEDVIIKHERVWRKEQEYLTRKRCACLPYEYYLAA